jgi:23S rRNA (cytidine2498-2'-O)-methyltransferase
VVHTNERLFRGSLLVNHRYPHIIATTSEIFVEEARRELQSVATGLSEALGTQVEAHEAGILFVTFPSLDLKTAYLSALRRHRPVFVRHIHTVDDALMAEGHDMQELENTLARRAEELLRRADGAEGLDSGRPIKIAVQVRRIASAAKASGGQIAGWLKAACGGAEASGLDADRILSCTALGSHIYLGLGEPIGNLSPRMGGAVHYNMTRFPVSRAGSKLEEAFDVFALETPAKGRAIDLGAAPGGWTAVLVDHGFVVDAIDPGDMHPTLLTHPNVRALKIKAQDFKPASGAYDLLTCDVNWDAKETALTVRSLAKYLAMGAGAIVTIKLNVGPAMPQILAVRNILEDTFKVIDVRLLFHNRREVTLYLKRA